MKSNELSQTIQTDLLPGTTLFQFGDTGCGKTAILRGLAVVKFNGLDKIGFLKPGNWFVPFYLSNTNHFFAITEIRAWSKVTAQISPDEPSGGSEHQYSFDLQENINEIKNLTIQSAEMESLFSILKIVNWAVSEYEGQAIPFSQIELRLKDLDASSPHSLRKVIHTLNYYQLVRLLNEDFIMVSAPDKIQILIEYIQEMLVIGYLNPVVLDMQYRHLYQVISPFSEMKYAPVKTKKKFDIFKIFPEIDDEVLRKILKLWSVKRLLKYESDRQISISNINCNEIEMLLKDFEEISPIILEFSSLLI